MRLPTGLAVSLIMAGALQGLGDTKSPLYSTANWNVATGVGRVIVLDRRFSVGELRGMAVHFD